MTMTKSVTQRLTSLAVVCCALCATLALMPWAAYAQCGGTLDFPPEVFPFTGGTSVFTETAPNRIGFGPLPGTCLAVSGVVWGGAGMTVGVISEADFYTTAPALDVLFGGVIASFALPGAGLACAAQVCTTLGGSSAGSPVAVTNTSINSVSGGIVTSFPIAGAPTGAVLHAVSGGPNTVVLETCVVTTANTLECVSGGTQFVQAFATEILAAYSWNDGTNAGSIVVTAPVPPATELTATLVSGGAVIDTVPLPPLGTITDIAFLSGGVSFVAAGGTTVVSVPSAPAANMVAFSSCSMGVPGGAVAINFGAGPGGAPPAADVLSAGTGGAAGVSVGWPPGGVLCGSLGATPSGNGLGGAPRTQFGLGTFLGWVPAKANKFQATLIQAMVSCTLPDVTTGGGTPACSTVAPISDRFAWCEGGSGSVKFKTGATKCKTDGTFPDCAFNPTVGPSGDLFIGLKLKGVCWGAGGVSPGAVVGEQTAPVSASLQLLGRPTTLDADVGVIQIIDFPAPVAFDIVKGKGKVKTSVNALINAINISSLSTYTTIEPVDVAIIDDLGGRFATPGMYLGKGN